MNDKIEVTLLLNLFYLENGEYEKNEHFVNAKRRKAIALLEEDLEELKEIDQELSQEYVETIHYLESISDEKYEVLKSEIIGSVDQKKM